MRLTDGDMKQTAFIGITGGVGSGKSEVLKYLRERTGSRIFCADEEAKKLYIPGSPVFDRIVSAAGRDILDEKGQPDRARFSEKLFKDRALREEINGIVHPAVEGLILDAMASEKISGKHEFLFIEHLHIVKRLLGGVVKQAVGLALKRGEVVELRRALRFLLRLR